jgi:hypothetical protein
VTEQVDQLTGDEGGRWRVHTSSNSYYDFDLEAMTVARHRAPGASATVNDGTRPIREIAQCRVGEAGRWTMRGDGVYLGAD